MNRNTFISLGILLTFFFASCKKESPSPTINPNFTQLQVGNYWIYEQFRVDAFDTATSLGVYDSCYVEKDTLINNNLYLKVIRPRIPGENYSGRFVRDSSHYLVNHFGQILFSSQNFTDTFYNYYLTAGGTTDTICEVVVKMADKDLLIATPAGQFQTSSFKQTYKMYPNWSFEGNLRSIDTRYSENIGIVSETFPFYVSSPDYIQRRLLRYKLN